MSQKQSNIVIGCKEEVRARHNGLNSEIFFTFSPVFLVSQGLLVTILVLFAKYLEEI